MESKPSPSVAEKTPFTALNLSALDLFVTTLTSPTNSSSVIVTDGSNPISWFLNNHSGKTLAIAPPSVVDTTGAGDAFNGGFAYALAEGLTLFEAIRYGSATAAISVTRMGTAPAMPYKSEIEDLLKK